MTFIEKLMISGIRSFSPNTSNIIEFYSPLTLIVGPNGTGKTTIIECLKYATTGSLPPNSKGGTFIYDPKVAHEVDIKGKVKIKFLSQNNEVIMCSRSIQASQKGKSVTQKTLETQLWRQIGGKTQNISMKCSDVDKKIPILLGVNTSILEHVIFCHQENSTWPLEDGASLKKKLDDIFASTKFSKALDSIKISKKETSSSVRIKSQELDFLLKEKIKRGNITSKIKCLNDELEQKGKRISMYDRELTNCINIYKELESELLRIDEKKMFMLKHEVDRLTKAKNEFCYELLAEDEIRTILEDKSHETVENDIGKLGDEIETLSRIISVIDRERTVYLEKKHEIDRVTGLIEINNRKCGDLDSKINEISTALRNELKEDCNFGEKSRVIFEKVENSLTTKKNEIYGLQEKLFILNAEIQNNESIIESNRQIIEVYKDLHLDGIVVPLGYADKIDELENDKTLEVQIKELECYVEQKQKEINRAYEIAEHNFEINTLRNKQHDLFKMLIENNTLNAFILSNTENLLSCGSNEPSLSDAKSMMRESNELNKTDRAKNDNAPTNFDCEVNMSTNNPVKKFYFSLNDLMKLKMCVEEKLESYKQMLAQEKKKLKALEAKSNQLKLLSKQYKTTVNNLTHEINLQLNRLASLDKSTSICFDNTLAKHLVLQDSKISTLKGYSMNGHAVDASVSSFSTNSKTYGFLSTNLSKLPLSVKLDKLDILLPEKLYTVANIEKKLEECKNTISSSASASSIYSKFIKIAEFRSECPLCTKKLDRLDKEHFMKRLENIITKIPSMKSEAEMTRNKLTNFLMEVEEENNKRVARNSARDTIVRLLVELFELKEVELLDYCIIEEKEMEILDIDEIVKRFEGYSRSVNEIIAIEKKIGQLVQGSLSKEAKYVIPTKLIKNEGDIDSHALNESTYTNNLSNLCSSVNYCKENLASKNVSTLRDELDSLMVQLKAKRHELERSNNKLAELRTKQEEINKLREVESRIKERTRAEEENKSILERNLYMEKNRLEELVKKRSDKLERVTEVFNRKRLMVQLNISELEKAQSEIVCVKKEQEEYEAELLCLVKQEDSVLDEEIKKFKQEILALNCELLNTAAFRKPPRSGDTIHELSSSNLADKNSNTNGDARMEDDKLTGIASSFVKNDTYYNFLKNKLIKLNNSSFEKKDLLSALEAKRNLAKENIVYYDTVRKLQKFTKELKEFDLEYFELIKKKVSQIEKTKTDLISLKASASGEYKQMNLAAKQLETELKNDYKDTVKNYTRCYIEVKALEAALLDIEKCMKALDKAIVEFHSTKIDEINLHLRELWANTYKGSDIDYIELRSETSGTKVYNYVIIMVKNGTELDMRNRSSAGQKMIASILIRLALAESFAIGCNILTLDEPTTNLDKDNIESLALVLLGIIKRHKENRRFQLVVITHDEDFVQLLCREGAEYFYRLSRDSRGDSVSERFSVYDTRHLK